MRLGHSLPTVKARRCRPDPRPLHVASHPRRPTRHAGAACFARATTTTSRAATRRARTSIRPGARSTRRSPSPAPTASSARWSPSRGGRIPTNDRVWRFRIRPGLSFQSGAPCDAEAVAEALRLHGDPVEAPINAFFWRNVAGVRAEGDEVLVELHEPSAGMPRLLRSWHSAIHNQAARRAAGDDFGRTTADGTGPFTFVESVSGSHLDVARWEGYRGAADDVAGERRARVPRRGPLDPDPRRPRARRGARARRDRLPPERLAARRRPPRGEPGPRGDRVPAVGARLHGRSTARASARDVRVRRAVSLAIDRQALVDRDLTGHGWPAYSPIPSHSQWYAPEVEASGGFDPREAAQLLDAAGLEPGARRRPARARDGGRERRHRPPRRRDDPRDARRRSASGSSSR